jgi:hypothetical protein
VFGAGLIVFPGEPNADAEAGIRHFPEILGLALSVVSRSSISQAASS